MLYAIVAVIALIADQALKYWTTANVTLDTGTSPLIPGVIHFAHIHNTGAAFSFLEGARWLFVALCVIFVAVVVWLLVKHVIATPGARWAAVFVLAGALGNCVDRVLNGYVVDMLEFEFIRFPVFNLADVFITVGAIVFCICLLAEKPAVEGGTAAATGRVRLPEAETETKAETKTATGTGTGTKAAAAEDFAAPRPKKTKNRDYVRTPYVAPTPAPRKPEPPPFDPANPFAEWENKPAQTKPAEPWPAASAPRAEPETPVESFDLNDIMSEFEDKK